MQTTTPLGINLPKRQRVNHLGKNHKYAYRHGKKNTDKILEKNFKLPVA
jgi:hypothetical protein